MSSRNQSINLYHKVTDWFLCDMKTVDYFRKKALS